MPKDTNTPAATVIAWLAVQLGPRALAPLTSTDTLALQAAVQVIHLLNYSEKEGGIYDAFRECVLCMQPHCREFAYHAVAHVGDWSARETVWRLARLPHLEPVMHCKFDCP